MIRLLTLLRDIKNRFGSPFKWSTLGSDRLAGSGQPIGMILETVDHHECVFTRSAVRR